MRNRYTVSNATGTIWYGFERAKLRNNGALVAEILFGFICLY